MKSSMKLSVRIYHSSDLQFYMCIWGIPGQIDQAETRLFLKVLFIEVCYRWLQKNDPYQFSDYLKFAPFEIVD